MDLSFTGFLGELLENPALLVTTLFTLGVIFVNGWTDAPNAIATCVTTRCLSARNAIIMSAFFNFLGVFIMTQINSSVASTISNMVDFGDSTQNALVALCAALAVPAFAADSDPLSIVNNLSDFIFSCIKAIGVMVLGWGIVQLGMSVQSHDASQRTQGILCVFGGLIIAFAKEILSAIGVA